MDTADAIRSVEIGIRENSGGQFYVAEKGLEAGARIVLEGVASLREGAVVKPREVNVDSIYSKLKGTMTN